MSTLQYTVLGAGGFIGSRLVSELRARGNECHAPSRDENIYGCELGHVLYCIGLTADYAARPLETVEAHVSLLSQLLAKGRFAHLTYLSSTRLYDGLKQEVATEEDDLALNPSNPRHIYDLSKAMGESLCLQAAPGRACVARLSCVYDAGEGAPGFLSGVLQRMRRERRFTLDAGSGSVRDYISLDDAAHALVTLSEKSCSGIFNVASGENLSNQDIAGMVNAEGYQVGLSRDSERETPPRCDISRINRLGLAPVGLSTYLAGFMKGQGKHAAG